MSCAAPTCACKLVAVCTLRATLAKPGCSASNTVLEAKRFLRLLPKSANASVATCGDIALAAAPLLLLIAIPALLDALVPRICKPSVAPPMRLSLRAACRFSLAINWVRNMLDAFIPAEIIFCILAGSATANELRIAFCAAKGSLALYMSRIGCARARALALSFFWVK